MLSDSIYKLSEHSYSYIMREPTHCIVCYKCIFIIILPIVCLCALTLYPATDCAAATDIGPIRCHRLLAVKPLSPREHAGRRVRKGGTLGSVHRHGRLDSTETAVVTVSAKDNRSLHIQTSGAESISSFRNRIIILD